MIDSQELFASLAHCPLSGKQMVRRGFVGDERFAGDVSERIDSLCCSIAGATDQAAAFMRCVTACVSNDFVDMCLMD